MFDKLSSNPPDQSVPLAEASVIPDPWETPRPAVNVNSTSMPWSFPKEPYLLISPAGNLGIPQLTTSQPNSLQLLLEQGLKLRAYAGGKLTAQIRETLALLYWIRLAAQHSPEVEMA
ncbi:MAG TPA: hypothetical protein V6D26_12140 [Stenomitos sp.]